MRHVLGGVLIGISVPATEFFPVEMYDFPFPMCISNEDDGIIYVEFLWTTDILYLKHISCHVYIYIYDIHICVYIHILRSKLISIDSLDSLDSQMQSGTESFTLSFGIATAGGLRCNH